MSLEEVTRGVTSEVSGEAWEPGGQGRGLGGRGAEQGLALPGVRAFPTIYK